MTDFMFLAVVELLVEDGGQSERAAWCLNAAGADTSTQGMSKVWARAVAVLRLPDDVREAAQWN